MLHELHIAGLGVIDDVDLEPDPGLTVLTGETGAGKTMITVAVGLATGARASAQLVRPGARAAQVQARFDTPSDDDGWGEDGEVVLARTVGADGRSGARIGGQIATAGALATLGGRLVEVHGQHQSLRLLEAATQTAFLDRLAGPEHRRVVGACGDAFAVWRDAAAELRRLRGSERDREREIDLLSYQVREIEDVGPVAGESDAIAADEQRLAHVERLLALSADADEALTGDEGGAADRVSGVAQALGAAAGLDPGAEELAARAAGLAAEVRELARDVRAYAGGLAIDPERLEALRGRLAALRGLQRKYGADDAEVVAFLETAAERVSGGRAEAAPLLAAALADELRELGMPGAEVTVELAAAEPGPSGVERAVLLLSPGDGQATLPLERAASGGELSRVMLACRSIAADLDDVGTLVFDEVDAGIGGQAGLAVGARLAHLATSRQVIVVTHLPQIACFADRHVRVRKDGGTASVEVLDDAERRVELSRMLAGLESSTHGISHADELLAAAEALRTPVSA